MAEKTRSTPALHIIKRIVRETIIISAGVGLMLIVSVWLGSTAEEATTEAEQVKNEMTQKSVEIQTLQAKITQFGNALPLWNNFKNKSDAQSFQLSRDEATNVFMELRDQYAFKDIRVSVSPIRASPNTSWVKSKIQVVESDVTINMSAYNDEQIVRFLQDIRQRLPGVIKVKLLRITRTESSQNRAGQQVEGGEYDELFALNEPQLSVNINILWYGIEHIDTGSEATPGAPGAPGMPGAFP